MIPLINYDSRVRENSEVVIMYPVDLDPDNQFLENHPTSGHGKIRKYPWARLFEPLLEGPMKHEAIGNFINTHEIHINTYKYI